MSHANEPYGIEDHGMPMEELLWSVSPMRVALDEAAARAAGDFADHDPFAVVPAVGQRLLLAQSTFNTWVLRRVEKVRFASDRRIERRASVEFEVPRHAPIMVGDDGVQRWLVPLTVMRRRTMVNLEVKDEQDAKISTFGLRFNQKLDEAILRAAARLARPEAKTHETMDLYVSRAISGDRNKVRAARRLYDDWCENPRLGADDRSPATTTDSDDFDLDALKPYLENPFFQEALERLWHNHVLYVALPVEQGRHRWLSLAFEEGVLWRYRLFRLKEQGPVYKYDADGEDVGRLRSIREFLGWNATRLRILTPSAESCASYHFEFTAPPGLWVPSAALVAGRPQVEVPGVTPWDAVTGTGHSAGLHVVEVPKGSLCQAQVELRIPSRGWLSTLLISCWAVFGVLAVTATHARLLGVPGQWTTTQITNIVLLLVTVSVGVSTYVAQHPPADVAIRMLSGLRTVGLLALSLPAFAAVSVVFLREQTRRGDLAQHPEWLWTALPAVETRTVLLSWLITLSTLSALAAMTVSLAWWQARRAERHVGPRSPWDMTTVDRDLDPREEPIDGTKKTFKDLVETLGLDRPAVGVASAEGWHDRYRRDDETRRVGSN